MAAEPAARVDPDRPVLPTDVQRRALRFLESVYTKTVKLGRGKSLKDWIRPQEGSSEHRTARDYVLQEVFRDWVRAGEVPAERVSEVGQRRTFYRSQTELAAPLIATSAREWMRGTLDIQQAKLSDVMVRALTSSASAHTAAVEVVEDAATKVVSIRDPASWAVYHPANFSWPRDGDTMTRVKKLQYIATVRDRLAELTTPSPNLGRATDRGVTRVEGFQLAGLATARATTPNESYYRPARLIQGYELLQLLLWHPQGASFVNAFQRSGLAGTQLATAALRDSLTACATARSTIDGDLSRVWRISPAVAAGVTKLGSGDPVSLTSYALIWAATEKTFIEKGIAFLSDVTAAIGLFGGPAGEVVEAIADVILSGASTAVSFLKQQEQEQAFLATAFEQESERLSSGGRYASTVLEGAAALVAAVALPGAVQSVTRRAKSTVKAAKQPARATPSASPTQSKDIARSLVTSDAGLDGTRATGIRGKANEDVYEAASSKRKRAPDRDTAASQGTGSKGSPRSQRSVDEEGRPSGTADPKRTAPAQAPRDVPRAVTDYLANLRSRFRRLENTNLRPAVRELSGSGLYDEALRTGSGRYSFEADFEGGTIQLDDITPEGVIVDIKMRDTGRTTGRDPRWAPESGESIPRDVVEAIASRAPVKTPRWKNIETIRETFGPQIVRQVRFAHANGLNGVVWQTNSPWMHDALKRIIKDYDLAGRYPRLKVEVELVP